MVSDPRQAFSDALVELGDVTPSVRKVLNDYTAIKETLQSESGEEGNDPHWRARDLLRIARGK